MKKLFAAMWICCIVLFLSGTTLVAQTITASVRGTVTDPSGAVLSGANVTATNVATGVASNTVTNASGLYNFQYLTLGNYTITASAAGFSTTSIGPFHLQIDQIAKIDAKLSVGTASTTVNVAAGTSPLLNTENATLGTSISAHALQNMPLPGLNAQYATMFVPGAVNPTVSSMGGLQGSYRATDQTGVPSFNGNRKQTNNYVLDGIEINETLANTNGYNPSPFSLQEVRVITGNADAEYGNVNGGEVIYVTKSGTNKFHGNAFEFFENQNLGANSWNNNYQALPKTKFTQHLFGGSVGGPIFRNKLFFYADYEGLQYHTSSEGVTSVPDALERTGNFSELLTVESTPIQLYNTGVTATNPTGGTTLATPYLNNQLPAVVNPVAKFLFAHPNVLPLPNHAPQANSVTLNNYQGHQASGNINNQVDGRVDYTVGSHDTLMVKGSYGDAHDLQTQVLLPVLFPTGDEYPFYMGVIDWIHTFSPSLVNEARAGYSRIVQNQGTVSDPSGVFGKKGDALVGIPFPNQPIVGFSAMNIVGTGEVGTFGVSNNGAVSVGATVTDNNFDYGDDLTWVHGKHITRMGAQFIRYQNNFFNPSNLGGLLGGFSYTGAYTAAGDSVGSDYADFELDDANSAQVSGVGGGFGQRQWRSAVYVQDDWKLRSNLTVNLGLRYAYDQPIYEVHDKMVSVNLPKAYFAPANTDINTLLEFAGKNGNSRALYNPYYNQFMPRVGFALQLDPRTVLRGGYSITDDLEGTGNGLRMTQNAPFQTSFTSNAPSPDKMTPGLPLRVENGFTAVTTPGNNTNVAGTVQYDIWDPNLRPATVQQFNLTTQFLISSKTSAQIGYVGELGQHIAVPVLANQYIAPVPATCPPSDTTGCVDLVAPYYAVVGTNQIVETTSRGLENYNALQATLQQQETNGLSFTFNYTWSKAMTNAPGGYFGVAGVPSGGQFSYWDNAYNPQGDYGRSNFDTPNNFNGTIVYQLPFGHKKEFGSGWNRVTDEALGGWALSANALLASGFPITIYENQTQDLNAASTGYNYNGGIQRANEYFKPRLVNRSNAHWFGTDPSAEYGCTARGGRTNAAGVACGYGRTATDQFGTARFGTERAPGSKLVDLSLFKAFRTVGDQALKLRIDAFNAFNMVSLNAPNARVGSGQYGKISSSLSGPRQFQISAEYQF